jgi:hypothetical protein
MAVITPKKRGRPRKDPMIAAVEAPKRRGRPAGTRKKHIVTVDSVRDEWANRCDEIENEYTKIIERYESQVDRLLFNLKNLEHQAVGYRAVISYLENTIERLIANPVRGN